MWIVVDKVDQKVIFRSASPPDFVGNKILFPGVDLGRYNQDNIYIHEIADIDMPDQYDEVTYTDGVFTKIGDIEQTPTPKPDPVPVKVWTRYELISKFTVDERREIRRLEKTDEIVEDFMDLLRLANEIRTDDPNFIDGLGYLVSIGKLTQIRLYEILGTLD